MDFISLGFGAVYLAFIFIVAKKVSALFEKEEPM